MRTIHLLIFVALAYVASAKYLPNENGSRSLTRNKRDAGDYISNDYVNYDYSYVDKLQQEKEEAERIRELELEAEQRKREQELEIAQREKEAEQRKIELQLEEEQRNRELEFESEQRKKEEEQREKELQLEEQQREQEEEQRKKELQLQEEQRNRELELEAEQRKKEEEQAQAELTVQQNQAEAQRLSELKQAPLGPNAEENQAAKELTNLDESNTQTENQTEKKPTSPTDKSFESYYDWGWNQGFEAIWQNFVYEVFGLAELSQQLEKEATVNIYLRQQLGLNDNSTKNEYHRAVIYFVRNILANDLQNEFRDYLQSPWKALYTQKLQKHIENRITELSTYIIPPQNVNLPPVAQVQRTLKVEISILKSLNQFLASVFPGWKSVKNPSPNLGTTGSGSTVTEANVFGTKSVNSDSIIATTIKPVSPITDKTVPIETLATTLSTVAPVTVTSASASITLDNSATVALNKTS